MKYHRSSISAFPKTTEYACAVERNDRRTDAWLERICWVGSFLLFGLAFSAPWWLP